MTLRWETLTPESVPAWAELTNLLGRVDGTEEFYDAEDLAEELTEDGFDPAKDSIAVWDGEQLVAFAQLQVASALTHGEGHVRAGLAGGVHPDHRGQGIATAMFEQMEPRALELATSMHPGAPIDLRVEAGLETDPVRALLTDRGYAPARYFTVMRRALPGAPVEPVDPRTTPLSEDLYEATRLAHNDAFASHWGSAPISAARWKGVVTGNAARPAFARVAVDAGGTVLAYCTTGQWVDKELYVTLVGTRQVARGQGLARAVLGATLAAAVEDGGFEVIELDVDSANPQGAGALYTSLGFVPVRTTATFVKPVPAAPVR
ncbi:GNAT family N-acetyltransferase [Ruania zhangjianzhongii]|uniref:GNAT family N-acetyltransferase n=1 Tax=Ruania zhangjianzhongii TaxID=2603206 RepID=UPI0011C7BD1B|nr:GNAT family N-acetyltransferase [Ruania zhangjianzhongii]